MQSRVHKCGYGSFLVKILQKCELNSFFGNFLEAVTNCLCRKFNNVLDLQPVFVNNYLNFQGIMTVDLVPKMVSLEFCIKRCFVQL